MRKGAWLLVKRSRPMKRRYTCTVLGSIYQQFIAVRPPQPGYDSRFCVRTDGAFNRNPAHRFGWLVEREMVKPAPAYNPADTVKITINLFGTSHCEASHPDSGRSFRMVYVRCVTA